MATRKGWICECGFQTTRAAVWQFHGEQCKVRIRIADLTASLEQANGRLAEVERETIERCAKVCEDHGFHGTSYGDGRNDAAEAIHALAPQNAAAAQDNTTAHPTTPTASAAAPLESILTALGDHGPEFRQTAMRVIGPVVEDAERWNALCNLWAASTELSLRQDEDGGWSITQMEPVENEVFWQLRGNDPESTIDLAIADKGGKNV